MPGPGSDSDAEIVDALNKVRSELTHLRSELTQLRSELTHLQGAKPPNRAIARAEDPESQHMRLTGYST